MNYQSADLQQEDPLALLLEYLDANPQPTFVLRLPQSVSGDPEQQTPLHYVNPALHQLRPLHSHIQSHSLQLLQTLDTVPQGNGSIRQNRHARNQSIVFYDIQWAITIVRDQWAVFTSTGQHGAQANSAQTGSAQAFPPEQMPSPPISDTATIETGRKSDYATPSMTSSNSHSSTSFPLGALASGAHLGDAEHLERLRQYDWKSSSCGPIESWPKELRQACEFALASPDAVSLVWGDDYTFIYNYGHTLISGDRHPRALGRPMMENWSNEWPGLEPVFRHIKESGEPKKLKNVIRMLCREGSLEEDFFDLTMIPILAANKSVAGIYIYVNETTPQVVFERRMQVLVNINGAMATAATLLELWEATLGVLKGSNSEVQFAAIYELETSISSEPEALPELVLRGTVGMADTDNDLLHREIIDKETGWNQILMEAFRSRDFKVSSTADNEITQSMLLQLQDCGVEANCREVFIKPLQCDIDEHVAAIIVMGANPLRKFNEDYQSFFKLLTTQMESAITTIRGVERERNLLRSQIVSEIEKRFWLFAEKAPVGMFMFDKAGSVIYCNAAFENFVGVSQEQLRGPMVWTNLIHPDGIDDISAIWGDMIKTGGTSTFQAQFKKPWTPHTGDATQTLDRTWGLGSSYAELSEDGEVKNILGCIADISSVKWAEKVQAARLSEALDQKRQRENFLDVISHEIRNPLNATFHCASELIERVNLHIKSEKSSSTNNDLFKICLDLATTITYCTNHQKRIVDDVLTLSKLDARLLQACPKSTDPIKLLEEILDLFKSELRASGIEPSLKVEDRVRKLGIELLFVDPHRVTQIIINLLSNAIKFTKAESMRYVHLVLDASSEEADLEQEGLHYVPSGTQYQDPTREADWGTGEVIYLSFSIRDTGPGMTKEEASNLFQRFSQASPRTHAQFGGSGLGLFISRELVEMHGGRIGLLSQPGVGSLFKFYVKCRRSDQLPPPNADNQIPNTAVQQLHNPPPILQSSYQEKARKNGSQNQFGRRPSALPLRMLIVEDNVINQRLLKLIVSRHGFETLIANNGEEALTIIAASAWNKEYTSIHLDAPRIDIVLCDIEMPIMDGKTCVRRIRQLEHEGTLVSGLPVIAVTGNARNEQVEEARECGFDAVITKPYMIPELLSVVERYVNKGREG